MATISESIAITSEGIYTVELAAYTTVNVTLYSAANDVVSFTDETGSKTCATNSSGVGTTSIQILTGGSKDITFTSSVAKSTTVNSNVAYSKTVTITESTTVVRLMPDKTIYWYGYRNATIESTNYGVANTNKAYPSLTFNTNSISTGVGSSQEGSLRIYNIQGITSGKLCIRTNTNHSNNSAQWRIYVSNSTSVINDAEVGGYGASSGMIEFRQAGVTTRNPYVLWLWMYLTQQLSPLYAIWLED